MKQRKRLFEFRKSYTQGGLSLHQVLPNPLNQFNLWFDQAVYAGLTEPNAMTLATSNNQGKVSARVVLLKEVDLRGFIFFTSYNSQKAHDIEQNPGAALVFLWLELERQVRVEGILEKVAPEESDEYFKTRPRESQLGAWASEQSKEISSRDVLFQNYSYWEEHYQGKEIPRPPFWGGYRLIPGSVEFWQGRPGRMHDRILYLQENNIWQRKRLSP